MAWLFYKTSFYTFCRHRWILGLNKNSCKTGSNTHLPISPICSGKLLIFFPAKTYNLVSLPLAAHGSCCWHTCTLPCLLSPLPFFSLTPLALGHFLTILHISSTNLSPVKHKVLVSNTSTSCCCDADDRSLYDAFLDSRNLHSGLLPKSWLDIYVKFFKQF